MTPSDLSKVAAKLGVSESVRRRNLSTALAPESTGALVANPEKGAGACGHKRIRQHRGLFDSELEREFGSWLAVDPRFPDCKIRPKGIRFRLPGGVFYTPDFILTRPGSNYITCFEVKGPKKAKGVSKGLMALKLAAGFWPEIGFRLVWKDGGAWREQQVHSE